MESIGIVVAGVALIASFWQQRQANALQTRLNAIEELRVAENEEERRRERSLGISAWWAEDGRGGTPAARPWGVVVANAQHFPVREVSVVVRRAGPDPTPALDLQVLPPGEWFFQQVRQSGKWMPAVHAEGVLPVMRAADTSVLSVEFTDAAGDRWRRDEARLEKVAEAPAGRSPAVARRGPGRDKSE